MTLIEFNNLMNEPFFVECLNKWYLPLGIKGGSEHFIRDLLYVNLINQGILVRKEFEKKDLQFFNIDNSKSKFIEVGHQISTQGQSNINHFNKINDKLRMYQTEIMIQPCYFILIYNHPLFINNEIELEISEELAIQRNCKHLFTYTSNGSFNRYNSVISHLEDLANPSRKIGMKIFEFTNAILNINLKTVISLHGPFNNIDYNPIILPH